jgi:hypothetical protein
MMQGGPPVEIVVPVFGMITGIIITGLLIIGPIGRSIGAAITYWLGGGRRQREALPAPDLEEVHDRLDVLQHQLAELAERQEFTERLLAKARQDRGLPGAEGGAG